MEQEKANKKFFPFSLKQILPIITLIILTLALMVYFRYNKKNISNFVESSKKSLISFYSENLKPLFFKSEITNEDIFNFAVNWKLPIVRENNKELTLVNWDSAGHRVFEIRSSEIIACDNYTNFKNYLQLNNEQKAALDSILSSYKKNIYSFIWINDKNTIAINPQLSELQEAILTDIVYYVSKIDVKKIKKLFPQSVYNGLENNAMNVLYSLKSDTSKDFIILTPDSVFNATVALNYRNFNDQYKEWEANLSKFKDQLIDWHKNKAHLTEQLKNFKINPPKFPIINLTPQKNSLVLEVDSNKFRIILPKKQIQHFSEALADSLRGIIFLASNLTFNGLGNALSNIIRDSINQKIKAPFRVKEEVKVNMKNIDKMFSEVIKEFSKGDKADWDKFGGRIDSIANEVSKIKKDLVHKK